MSSAKYLAIGAAFEALSVSGIADAFRRFSKCRGVIFTLHRVLPERPADFSPNAILQVTPKFLAAVIEQARARGFDTVSMDEAVKRIRSDEPTKPFVVFTFDDAYRDNLTHALPVLRRLSCPFTLYVPTALVDGVGQVWWQALEDMIATRDGLSVPEGDTTEFYRCSTLAEKQGLFSELYARMRSMPEDARVTLVADLAERCGLDLADHCRSLVMDWSEVQVFADEPLCTIGAHTVHHYELSKLTPARMKSEIAESLRTLFIQLGERPRHFSYPIGSRVAAGDREYEAAKELGIESAVTTIPGGLYARHRDTLERLPRISLNGNFQSPRHIPVFLTGGLFSLAGQS